jgi:hypothetical protein
MPVTRVLRDARLACLLALGFACSATPSVSTLSMPPPDDFAPVSAALASSCGSLDCHGRRAQNLRFYGSIGLRLDPEDLPGGDETTSSEHDANYRSILAFEPEAFSSVWLDGGRDPARLTLVRKARGREAHKGGAVFPEGGDGDRCLLSWLSGELDLDACTSAAELPLSPFEPDL